MLYRFHMKKSKGKLLTFSGSTPMSSQNFSMPSGPTTSSQPILIRHICAACRRCLVSQVSVGIYKLTCVFIEPLQASFTGKCLLAYLWRVVFSENAVEDTKRLRHMFRSDTQTTALTPFQKTNLSALPNWDQCPLTGKMSTSLMFQKKKKTHTCPGDFSWLTSRPQQKVSSFS